MSMNKNKNHTMKAIAVLIICLLFSNAMMSEAVVGKVVVKLVKPVVSKIRTFINRVTENVATHIAVEKVSEKMNEPAPTQKPKYTSTNARPFKTWEDKIKNEKKSNSTCGRQRCISR